MPTGAGPSTAPKMGQARYFGIDRGSNLVDAGMAGDHATCYGVNLAVRGLGVGFRAWGHVLLRSRGANALWGLNLILSLRRLGQG